MTALAQILIDRIGATGPMTIADYMAECLLHPEHGYYSTRDPFGAHGDFTTAPEVSQTFGEMIGLCLAQTWIDQGRPDPIVLAELGPGRGTLMSDVLRAAKTVPGFNAAAQVVLVEASAALREVQKDALAPRVPVWVDTLSELPSGPLYLVANEFFDALPIRQFERATAGWAERVIGVEDGQLVMGRAPVSARADLVHRLTDTAAGDIVEMRPAVAPIFAEMSDRIIQHGGVALIIDYGSTHSLGDTLQAVRKHEFTHPLETPGQADLTAHVDFEPFMMPVKGLKTSPLTTQGVLLERLGITQRAQELASRMTGTVLKAHVAAHRRLTHPDEMGTLFKALALVSERANLPPGFDQ